VNYQVSQLNIAQGVATFARATPNAIAVMDQDRCVTFAALEERANRFANALLGAGVGPGQKVAMMLPNSVEFCEISAGAARVGAAIVPINPHLTAPEVAYQLGHSEASALVAHSSLAETACAASEAANLETRLLASVGGPGLGRDYESLLADADPSPPAVEVEETSPFCVNYTSGTTGKPKGVLISHRSRCLTFLCAAIEWGLGPGRTTVAVAPLYHGAGFAFGYGALYVGASVAMLPPGPFDPGALLDTVERTGAQTMFLVPAHAQRLREQVDPTRLRRSFQSVEVLYFNAAPLPQALKLWLLDSLPEVALHELYGSTEAGIVTDLRPVDQRRKQACVGPPWLLTELVVLDDSGAPVEPGQPGELFSRSPFLMNGYLKDPEATSACMTEDGFLTSGDVVTLDEEGFVYVVDRKKDMIITGGINVYPREVEEVLLAHPAVADVAVVGLPSEAWGEEVTAVVVARSGRRLDVADLERHCRASLASFKVPKRWVESERLPRNAAGKVLKTELRRPGVLEGQLLKDREEP